MGMRIHWRPKEGWSTLIILLIMLLSVGWSINAAEWSEGLWTLQPVILGGFVVGLILSSFRRLPGSIAHTLSVILGIAWTVFITAWLLPWEYTWPQALNELYTRFVAWLQIARGEGVSRDNLVFVMQLEFLMWLMSYICTWFFIRLRNVWGAVIPSGFALLVNVYYAPPDVADWLLFYTLAALLLIVRSFLFLQEEDWRAKRIGYNPDIGFDFLRDGIIFAILVVAIAWLAPATASPRVYALVDRFEEPWARGQAQFRRLFSSLNYRARPGPAYFSNTLAFTGPVNLGDAPIFDVVTTEGRYWRGMTYDQYTSHGWINTDTNTVLLNPGDPRMSRLPFEAREPVTQTIRILQGGSTQLYAVPQPAQFNMPVRVQYGTPIQEGAAGGVLPLDISSVRSQTSLKPGQVYQAISSISKATERQLREAGTDYPEWVRERYLQLPDTLPSRVRELAQQITAPYDNPYDQVTAIESYLRKLKYNEQIEAPPPGRDGVDYFLFDLRQGYCDYYASALVVMARAVGIPARLAAGYSRGEYVPELEAYRQREYDAHSWPEVFFPGYGWIEFEPTAADPVIQRPSDPRDQQAQVNPIPTPGGLDKEALEKNLEENRFGPPPALPPTMNFVRSASRLALPMMGILVALGVMGLVVWFSWQRGLQGLPVAAGLYARMVRLARYLGVPEIPHQTPYEHASRLSQAVPQGEPDITQIADGYVKEQFSPRGVDTAEVQGLQAAWQRLRRVLVGSFIERTLMRITGQVTGSQPKNEK